MTTTAVVFASAREARPFTRRLGRGRPYRDAPSPASMYAGPAGYWLVVVSGTGMAAAERATRWLVENAEPELVISAGFAGGLSLEFGVGFVVIASRVVDEIGNDWRTQIPAALGHLRVGRLVCVSKVVPTAAAKAALRAATGAGICDMESAAVADVCAFHKVPFAAVKVISDAAETNFSPALSALFAGGEITPLRAAVAVLRRPRLIAEFWRLARDSKKAAAALAAAFDRYGLPDDE